MSEQTIVSEDEAAPLDISDRVMAIIDDPEGELSWTVRLHDLLRSLRREQALTITLDWRGENMARWAKAFLDGSPAGQKRSIAIRCTEVEKNLARNVFASGVKWINSETEAQA